MKTQRLLADPKTLYRLLEDVFERADDRFGGRRLLAACAQAFLDAFRHELGLEGAALYCAHGHNFHLESTFDRSRRSAPSKLAPEAGLLAAMEADGVAVARGPAGGAPLPGACVGLLVEEPRARHALFLQLASEDDVERTEGLARPLRAALSARILQNRWGNAFREAAEIQRGLLPARPPGFAGYDIAARSQPAEEVGGDVYDLLALGDDVLGFMLADASGHGLPAALVARDVMVGLRMGVRSGLKATRVVEHLNAVMHTGSLSSSFVSAFYGELGDDGTLLYVNAGHPAPLVVRADGIVELAWGDTVLGPAPDARFRRHVAHLDPGDTLVAVTDGILERRNTAGTFFGLGGMEAVLEAHRGAPAEAVVAGLYAAAGRFGPPGSWEDDATALVIRRLPLEAPEPGPSGFAAGPR